MRFIDDSFRELRSAKGAFELQQNFKEFKTRPAIEALMENKYPEIFDQFSGEIEEVLKIFMGHKENPPRSKNQPPVAGAIYWARSLFHRVSKTWLLFQKTSENIFDSPEGQKIIKNFNDLARRMAEFESEVRAPRLQRQTESVSQSLTHIWCYCSTAL